MKLIRRSALLAAGVLMTLPAWAVEILEWERRPLEVPLPVGSERIVVLDRNVRVGLPASIADPEILRVQSTGGVLYLLAREGFDAQRVQLQDVESGDILLLDLSARQGASDEEIRIVDAEPATETSTDEGQDEARAGERPALPRAPTPVALTRFAAQSLYAPMRAVEALSGAQRVPMRLPESLPSLMPVLPVDAKPLGAWSMDGYTVTAVRLTNRDPARAFELDPRWLQGDLYSATFMHPSIGPRGSVEDTTTLFVVTRGGGLGKAMLLPPGSDDAAEEDDA